MRQFLIGLGLKKKPTPLPWSTSVYRTTVRGGNNSIEFLQQPKAKFEGTFREAIWPIWLIAQVFAVMPVCGVSSKSISNLGFSWKSKRTIYSSFVAIVLVAFILMLLFNAFTLHGGVSLIELLVFYYLNTIDFLCFLALASKWPRLVQYWTDMEGKLPSFRSLKQKRRFIFKIRSVAFGFLFLALIEHNMNAGVQIYYLYVCRGKDPILEHVKIYAAQLYTEDEYIGAFEAISIKMIFIFVTFVWSYRDLFLLTIGMALTMQFKLFNEELNRAKRNHMSQEFWSNRRLQYNQLCELVRTVDTEICHFILLSFINNFFFICKQLFLSLKPLSTTFGTVYFWYSLFFIVLRTCFVSFSLSNINEESKQPLYILNALPTRSWNTDTERFSREIANETVALSGMRFFYVTRKLMLSVLATIVTYELVLLQFNINYSGAVYCVNTVE